MRSPQRSMSSSKRLRRHRPASRSWRTRSSVCGSLSSRRSVRSSTFSRERMSSLKVSTARRSTTSRRASPKLLPKSTMLGSWSRPPRLSSMPPEMPTDTERPWRPSRSELAEKLRLLDQSIRHAIESVKTGVIKEIADRRVWKCLRELEELSSKVAALGMHSEDLELKEFEAKVNDFEREVSEKVN